MCVCVCVVNRSLYHGCTIIKELIVPTHQITKTLWVFNSVVERYANRIKYLNFRIESERPASTQFLLLQQVNILLKCLNVLF